jgi:hypothetical protein
MVEKILHEDTLRDYRDVLEMPSMPNNLPLGRLMSLENDIRNLNDEQKLADFEMGLEDYWKDWAKVLVSHRLQKLGKVELANQSLLSTSFEGYKYFVKE